jgi:NAD(P)-dependent dehydrogenase (short-subunit alcohol dehydrogenase family)
MAKSHSRVASPSNQTANARTSGSPKKVQHSGARPQTPMPAQHQERPGLEAEIEPRPQYEAAYYKGSGKLQDKNVLVTGGDSGIGRAVAVLAAREGANVAIVYLPQEQEDAEETREAIEREHRKALLLPGDVTDPSFCEEAVKKTVEEFGGLDVLVNNAGYQQHQSSLEDLSIEQFDRTFKTNIYGYFYMVKSALPHLKQGSAIINTGSETGLEGSKQLIDYSATKGAIHAFTKALSQMLIDRGIRVNGVAPGPIWTPFNVADKEAEQVKQFGAKTPMHRPGQPEEVAPAYIFLASEQCSSYISGEIISVMGGATTAA